MLHQFNEIYGFICISSSNSLTPCISDKYFNCIYLLVERDLERLFSLGLTFDSINRSSGFFFLETERRIVWPLGGLETSEIDGCQDCFFEMVAVSTALCKLTPEWVRRANVQKYLLSYTHLLMINLSSETNQQHLVTSDASGVFGNEKGKQTHL